MRGGQLTFSGIVNAKGNSQSYKIASEIKNSGEITTAKMGALAVQIMSDVSTKKGSIIKQAVQKRANELGVDSKTKQRLTSYLTKAATKGNIETVEIDAVGKNAKAQQIITEIKNSEAWAEDLNTQLSSLENTEHTLQNAITFDTAENSLQQGSQDDIINNNQDTGVDINGSTNPELLAGREVSATNRGENYQRQYGANTEIIRISLENAQQSTGISGKDVAAGESGWLSARNFPFARTMGRGLDKNFLGSIQGVALKNTDSIGRIITPELQEKLSPTVFKTEEGTVISFFHWSPNSFNEFKFGDGAFHLGTLSAAITVKNRDAQQREGHILEGYVISKNPLITPDLGKFGAYSVCEFLLDKEIITKDELKKISQMDGFLSDKYDAPANVYVRELLKSMGYDTYLYQNLNEDLGSWSVGVFDADQIVIIAENGVLKENSGVTEADTEVPANFMPENDTSDSGEFGFSEPTDQEIYRDPTDEENREAMFGRRKNAKQRHILDVAKKLDSGIKVVFVSENAKVLSGQKGVYMRESNTMYLSESNSAVESYYQVFKHEFIHRLESKGAYQSFKNYLFKHSSAFEKYARAQLGESFKGTREEALQAFAQKYIDTVQNGSFSKAFKDGFTVEDAQYEMVADFISEVLFKGNRADVAQNLADSNLEAIFSIEDTLSEFESLSETDRTWFQKIIDAIRDFIASLKGVKQNERLVNDLEYIEKRLARVLDSKDTKKAASRAGNKQYHLSEDARLHEYIEDALAGNLPKKSFYKVNETISDRLATDIEKIVGFSVKGYSNEIAPGNIQHIENEHGANGRKDQSMKNHHDLARVSFVVDNYEKIKEGKISGEYKNSDGTKAKTIELQKKIDDEFYYVVEAVPDASLKTLHIVSAYKNKKDTFSDVPVSNDPRRYVQDEHQPNVSNDIILNEEPSVKDIISEEDDNYSETPQKTEGQFSLGSPAQQMRDNLKKYESGEITREEYLEETDRLWGKANETFGAFETGENAKAPIATPTAVAEDKPTERFTRTIIETGKLTEEMLQGMEEKVLLGDFSYEVISDEYDSGRLYVLYFSLFTFWSINVILQRH